MTGGHKVLVVDDENRIREICREVLELEDYEVMEAENGRRALEIMSESSFSLVLSDIMMPDIDGLELAARVRDLYPDTFVILITGHGTVDLAKEAIRQGAFDFIAKPFQMGQLSNIVERAFEVRSKRLSSLPSPVLEDLYGLSVDLDPSDTDPSGYLDEVCRRVGHAFGGDGTRIYLTDRPGGEELSLSSSSGDCSVLDDDAWASFAGDVMSDGGLLAGEGAPSRLPEGCGAVSLMAVSIPSVDGPLGACVSVRSSTPSGFTPRDLQLAGLFAAQAGNQMMNYSMTEDLRRHASNLSRINVLSGEFSSTLDTNQVLSSIGTGLRSMVPFDLFGVFLRGEGMDPLSYVLARDDMPDWILERDIRRRLERHRSGEMVEEFLEYRIEEAFRCDREADWESGIEMRVLDLGEFGRFSGMIVLAGWSSGHPSMETSSFLPIIVRNAAAALSNAYLYESSERNYIQAITALAGAVDAKDPYTSNHSRNVAAYCVALSENLELSPRQRELVHNAALLHDIGKIGVPEAILNKPGSLTAEEYGVLKQHPDMGYRILRPVTAFSGFTGAVRHHHERWDGKGYPHGLRGEGIPFAARILTVADAFDSMTSDRVYRSSPGLGYARAELESGAGSQFDPDLAESFLCLLREKDPREMIADYLGSGGGSFLGS